MSTEILETSPVYQLWVQQGLQQGLEQGLRQATLLAMRGRFGELTPDIEQVLAMATPEVIEGVLGHVATETLEELRTRLGL